MEQPKCPECGSPLWRGAIKCKKCGLGVVICRECGSAYKKGERTCDMCGRELKKIIIKRQPNRSPHDNSAPNDLVSIINNVKAKSIGFRIVRFIRWITFIVFAVALAFSVPVGLLIGETPTDLCIAIAFGNRFAEVWELLITTFTRTVDIWRVFIGDLINNEMTLYGLFRFLSYLVASFFPATLVFAVYYAAVHIPLHLIETVICGVIAKKRGYSAADTVAVFECPTLIFNSDDSFDKAYTYFPFVEKTKGKIGAIMAYIIPHAANLSLGVLAMGVFSVHSLSKIAIWILLGRVTDLTTMYFILAVIVIFAIFACAVAALLIRLLTNVICGGIHKRQLSKWSKINF